MKYKCFCHRDNYEEITKDEARNMLRSYKRFALGLFMDNYNIPDNDIYNFMRARGMTLSHTERRILRERETYREELAKSKGAPLVSKRKVKIMSYDVSEWPVALVSALENVSYETIKGKRSYDLEEYQRAAEKLQNRIDNYFSEQETSSSTDLQLTKSDLIAMRYYRGVNRMNMAKKLLVNKRDIVEMETTSPVPKEISEAYRKALNIKESHVHQLRKIMTGKLSRVEDDRTIPGKIKVAVYRRDKGCCSECGDREKLHYHHIEYFSKGGQNTIENLKLLCASCHAEVHRGEKSYHMLKKMAEEKRGSNHD